MQSAASTLLSTDAPDPDAFVWVEEVDRKQNPTYISLANLRALHRTSGQSPFENLNRPWYNRFESELQPIPAGEPVELVPDLLCQPHTSSRKAIAFVSPLPLPMPATLTRRPSARSRRFVC
jgi:hypothetical protein